MVSTPVVQPPRNVRETIAWLERLGRPPLPECPIEAAKNGKEPKQPHFLDQKGFLKSVSWKQWQSTQPIREIVDSWFCNSRTGIGTLGGWNGRHWLGWIDFDQKDFSTTEECDRALTEWQEQYPLVKEAPRFRTPGGGLRILVAFDQEPQNFKANSGFSLKVDGSHHVGELLSKSGGHTLLPPTIGVTGKPYYWEHWAEYPPIVHQPEDIGIYPVKKVQDIKAKAQSNNPTHNKSIDLSDFLESQIYPRLSADRAFNWHGHQFKEQGDKVRGNCPWHESQSGTAFYAERKDNKWLWRCPACEIGGGVVEYRHRLGGGNGSPTGKQFVDIVKELAGDVGVAMPAYKPKKGSEGDHNNSTSRNADHHKSVQTPILLRPYDRVKEIVERHLSPSGRKESLILLSQGTGVSVRELEKLAEAIEQEIEVEDQRADAIGEIDKLLTLSEQTISLFDYLPNELAQPITDWCKWLNIRPAVALTAVLTAVSSLHKTGTELIIHKGMDFKVPPIIFSALVAESGQRKSPVFRTLIRQPLGALQKSAKEQFQRDMSRYEDELRNLEKGDDPPKKPCQKIYYFSDATGEGIKAQAERVPEKSLMALIDELAGYFNAANGYRNGKGSDRQDVLSYFDGLGQTVLRSSDGIKVDVDKIYLSIFGTIQPDILKNLTKDLSDSDGHWARFLFVNQPLAVASMPDDTSSVDISERLAGIYKQIDHLPLTQYTLSKEAFKRYQTVYNKLEQLRVSHLSQGMRAVYSKFAGYIGRLAINLHVLHEIANGVPSPKIELGVMDKAIALASFYVGQVQILHATTAAESGELSAKLAKILAYASASGRVTPREIVTKFNFVKTSPQAKDLLKELEFLGYGSIEKEKRNWFFVPRDSRNELGDSRNGSRNGLEPISNNDSGSSRNERNGSRNGLEPISNNDSGSSRNERNDFLEFSICTDNTHLIGTDEEGGNTITPLRSLREIPQTPIDNEFNSRNGSRNAPLTDHYANENTEPTTQQNQQGDHVSSLAPTTVPNSQPIVDSEINSRNGSYSKRNADHYANENSPTTTPSTLSLVPQTRVRVHYPGSKRDQKEGIVIKVSKEVVIVKLDDQSLGKERIMEIALPFTDMSKLEAIA